MPRGDGTGPMNPSRMTGRGAGYCAGYATPGYANSPGFGHGFGRGRRLRRMQHAYAFPRCAYFGHPAHDENHMEIYDEKESLNREAKFLGQRLKQIEDHLSHLDEEDEE